MPVEFSRVWDSLLLELEDLIDLIPQTGKAVRNKRNAAVRQISDTYDTITQYQELERLEAPGVKHDAFLVDWERLGYMIARMIEDPEGYDTNARMEQRKLENIVDVIREVRW